ncbi:MAG: hypothetical protein IKN38_07715, partial [Clostridia bacterium]|nr:hypothetical protein [Clostridia bacterium]
MMMPLSFISYAAASDWIDGTGYPEIAGLTIQTSKAYPMTYSGGEFASSNQGAGSKTSGLKITPSEACILSFEAKISSEGNWDYLSYSLTEQVNNVSGNIYGGKGFSGTKDWTPFSVAVSAGQSLYIVYYKDSSGNSGSDTMWLRNISTAAVEYCAVSVSSEDTNAGTAVITSGVTDGQAVKTGSVTVKATPASGFRFNGWYDGASRVSTSTTYTFTVSADVELVAKFDAKVKDLTATYHLPEHVSATYKRTREGSTTAATALPADGVITGLWQDDKIALTLTLDTDYVFMGWFTDSALTSGQNTTKDKTDTISTSNVEYWCKAQYDGWVTIDHEYEGISSIQSRGVNAPAVAEDGTLTCKTYDNTISILKMTAAKSGYMRVYYSADAHYTSSQYIFYYGINDELTRSNYTSISQYSSAGYDHYLTNSASYYKKVFVKYVQVNAGDSVYWGFVNKNSTSYPNDTGTFKDIAVLDEIPYVTINTSVNNSTMGNTPTVTYFFGNQNKTVTATNGKVPYGSRIYEIKSTSKAPTTYIADGWYKVVNNEEVLVPDCKINNGTSASSNYNLMSDFVATEDATYVSKFVDKSTDGTWDMYIHVPSSVSVSYSTDYTNAASFVAQTPDANGIVTISVTAGNKFGLKVTVTDPEASLVQKLYTDASFQTDSGISYSASNGFYVYTMGRAFAPGGTQGNHLYIRAVAYESVPGFSEPAADSGISAIQVKTDDYAWTLYEDGS